MQQRVVVALCSRLLHTLVIFGKILALRGKVRTLSSGTVS